jgi:hypothetical protein
VQSQQDLIGTHDPAKFRQWLDTAGPAARVEASPMLRA